MGRECPRHVYYGAIVHRGYRGGTGIAQRQVHVKAVNHVEFRDRPQSLQSATYPSTCGAFVRVNCVRQFYHCIALDGGGQNQGGVVGQRFQEFADIGLDPTTSGTKRQGIEPDIRMHISTPSDSQK